MFVHLGMPVSKPETELPLIRQINKVFETVNIPDSSVIYLGVDFYKKQIRMQFQVADITDKQLTAILLLSELTLQYDSRWEPE